MLFDIKNMTELRRHTLEDGARIQTLCLLNNSLHLSAGTAAGNLYLINAGSLAVTSSLIGAHDQKFDQGVHGIVELCGEETQEGGRDPNSLSGGVTKLPLMATVGADSRMRILEHNLYRSE